MIVTDKVLFLFPKDRELQFPAAAILQNYVNGYRNKMLMNNPVSNPKAKVAFELQYDVEVSEQDWQFFKDVGLKLDFDRVSFEGRPDAVIDLSEKRLALFGNSGKHACQVMGIMSGVLCPPLPAIRSVKPIVHGRWGTLDPFLPVAVPYVTAEELMTARDGEWTGIIGNAGWEIYLAASMALPTIEVIAEDRPRMWLSKWANMAYRAVDPVAGFLTEQLIQAKDDLERMVERCLQVPQDSAAA